MDSKHRPPTALRWDDPQVQKLINLALAEDIGGGDVTTEACVSDSTEASGYFLARQRLVVAGTPLLGLIYDDEEVGVDRVDGEIAEDGEILARVSGTARRLLTLERTALNLLQRTCGIATLTRRFVEAIEGTGCTLLDTRKTQPGLRLVDKLAVRAGGGTNHRMGLFDAILIKNNHVEAAGGVAEAIRRCRRLGLPIEVEVRDTDELHEALGAGARHVLLDNFTPDGATRAVQEAAGRATIEVSGNLSLQTVRSYAETGADYASVGALTHSAPAADISFRFD